MLRPIAIALILVLSVGIMLPFANEAHGLRQTVQVGQRRHHRYRSRAWWRRYRARLRQKRLAAEMAHRNQMMSLPQNLSVADLQGLNGPQLPSLPSNSAAPATLPPPEMTAVPVAAVSNAAHASSLSNGETRPRVVNPNHAAFKASANATPLPGTMNLAVIAMSRPNPAFLTSREEKKMLGGVAVAED